MRCQAAKTTDLIILIILWTTPIAARCRHLARRAPAPWEGEDLWDGGMQQNRIDGVIQAAQSLINEAYPDGVPSGVNIQTAAWPSSFEIGGTTYTGVPTPTAAPTSTVWWTPSSSTSLPSSTTLTTMSTSMSSTSTTSLSTTTTTSSSSTSSTSSSTSTTKTRTSSSTPTATSYDVKAKRGKNDGDWKVAISLGVIIISAAVAVAAAIFFALWRRKKHTGSYFKAVRDAEMASTAASSSLWGGAGSVMSGRTERTGGAGGSRSWFGGPPKNNTMRTNFPDFAHSAEKLARSVSARQACITEREVPVVPLSGVVRKRGHSRLQKSNSTNSMSMSNSSGSTRRGVPEFVDDNGMAQSHELMGDDLPVINELDAESPARAASSLRRLSSFPFVLGSDISARPSADADYTALISSRSSSDTTKAPASELDAEETSRRPQHHRLRPLSCNPIIVADVVSRSNSDNSKPSEMDGESPTRRASTWRELQRSTFTVNDLTAEIEKFNALPDSVETGSSTDVTSPISDPARDVPGPMTSPTSTLAFSELPGSSVDDDSDSPTAPTSPNGSSSSRDSGPIGFVSSSKPVSPLPAIKTTELYLPPRPPMPVYNREHTASISPASLSSHTPHSTFRHVSPLPGGVSDREYVLNRARYQSPKASPKSSFDVSPTSPLPTTPSFSSSSSKKPGWAPAGAYSSAPIWRKKRPAPIIDPSFLSPMASPAPTSFEEYQAANGGGAAAAKGLGLASNNPYKSLATDKRKSSARSQPWTPDWVPESLRAGRQSSIRDEEKKEGEDHEEDGDDDDNADSVMGSVGKKQRTYSAYSPSHGQNGTSGGGAEGDRAVGLGVSKGPVHYPSWASIQGFDFDDKRESARVEDDGGWKRGSEVEGKYDLMS